MMKKAKYIVVALAALLLLASCASKSEHKIISKKDFAKIYAEMFICDQWINVNHRYTKIADTTLVYEPIFEKYGYTTDDYLASVDYYLYDPTRFNKIIIKAVDILEKQKAAALGSHKDSMSEEDFEDLPDERNR